MPVKNSYVQPYANGFMVTLTSDNDGVLYFGQDSKASTQPFTHDPFPTHEGAEAWGKAQVGKVTMDEVRRDLMG